MALYAVALLFGTRVAETILASVHVRAHPQAGHMDASNLIKALQNTLRGGGRPHMGLGLLLLLAGSMPVQPSAADDHSGLLVIRAAPMFVVRELAVRDYEFSLALRRVAVIS